MGTPVIVDAARTPFGKRNGTLAGVHPARLLGRAQRQLLARNQIEPAAVGQVFGGCVTQAGEQSSNVARTAWLAEGLPYQVGATTIDSQCGSAQQALHLITALVAADVIDTGLACGVEAMSRVPLMSNFTHGPGKVRPAGWTLDMPSQFVGADRIARRRGFSRDDLDAFGLRSQERAAKAWADGRLDGQILPIELVDEDGQAVSMPRDQGLRATSLEALAGLRPVLDDGLHTAGTSSQISDGASAALVMDEKLAVARGLRPRARLRSQCLIGGEPEYLLDGPIEAARGALQRAGMTIDDIDVVEVNEAFAAVPMSLQAVLGVDDDKLNVNGGAIAIGHPVGATGIRLIATALGELERRDAATALVAICTGGAMATACVLERIG